MPDKLPVIFRHDGEDVTAVFPTLPGTKDPHTMTCYAHIGQHGACVPEWMRDTRPATPDECAPLLAELRSIYETGPDACRLDVRQRITQAMRRARFAELRRVAA